MHNPYQQMNLSTIVWKEISDDNFLLTDGDDNKFQCDIDEITNYATRALLFADLDTWRQDCSLVPSGGSGPPTEVVGTWTHVDVTGAGSTTNDILGLVVTNIGSAAGTIGAGTLAAGQTEIINAIFNPAAGTFTKVPSVSYDATGTTFTISELV